VVYSIVNSDLYFLPRVALVCGCLECEASEMVILLYDFEQEMVKEKLIRSCGFDRIPTDGDTTVGGDYFSCARTAGCQDR
jgi:hypothetical protein